MTFYYNTFIIIPARYWAVKPFAGYIFYNPNMILAKRLRELREEKGLSQQQLADKTALSSSAIARWELRQSEPTATAISILCEFFDVSGDYLLGRVDY